MRRHLLLIILIVISASTFAQSKNEISILYGKSFGPALYTIISHGFLKGAGSSSLRENNSIGIRYLASIKNRPRLKFEIGIDYLIGKLEIKPAPTGDPIHDASHTEDFSLISTPIFLNHYFGKYFYINEGIMLDYQKTESDNDTYTGYGVGIGFGIGAKFKYKNFTFNINPKLERHLFLSKKDGLIELGIMLGVGYKF
ncbi:MAG: hypothetical protein WC833_13745 [Bacteroidales bacterium]|jgi:hypothetical protein